MRLTSKIGGLVLSALLLSAPYTATADITLNANAVSEIPRATPVTVEIFDDSNENLELRAAFERLLDESGYSVQESAPLILSVETRDTAGTWTGGGTKRIIELGNSDDHTGTDAPDVRVSIYDSQRGGILNQRTGSNTQQVTPSTFRIDVALTDRSNGRMLWQGWATIPIGAADDQDRRKAMVAPLVDSIGKTIRSERVGEN